MEDLEGVQAPRAGGHHPGQGDVVVRIRDGAQRLLEVADLRRREQRQAADHGVRDVLVSQPRHDRLAVLVLPVQDRGVRPFRVLAKPIADGIDDDDRLVLRAGADDQVDLLAHPALGAQPLVRLEARLVATDEPIGRIQQVALRPEVLLDPEARRWTGRSCIGIVPGRAAEASIELAEGGEAGAAEAVDRLVVVPHHHHVVGPIRRAAEQLDQLDLRDVHVLELVDQDVAELALPSAQEVGADLEELRHGGDLLAEVEGAALHQLLLVRAVDDVAISVRRITSRAAPSST